MNWLDYVILLLILVSTALGTARGFIRAVFGFVSTLLGVFLGARSYEDVSGWFSEYLSSQSAAHGLAFILVFLGVLLLGALFGNLVSRTVDWAGLRWLDHLLGGGLGLIRGGLVGAALVMVMCAFSLSPPPKSVVGSRIAPSVMGVAYLTSRVAPPKMRERFDTASEMVEANWAKNEGKGGGGGKKGGAAKKGKQAASNTAENRSGGE